MQLRCSQPRFYNTKYDANSPDFWSSIELPDRPDKEYVCIGVKASNYFMPKDTLSEKGPGGGGWILMAADSDRKILAEFFLHVANENASEYISFMRWTVSNIDID